MNLKCLFGHQWNDSCKCERCGEIRDELHNWIPLEGKCEERCSVCGKEQSIDHKWNGCKCGRCGTARDVEHKWTYFGKCSEKCSICGKERSEHSWDGCKCKRCGETRNVGHRWYSTDDGEKCSICGKERSGLPWEIFINDSKAKETLDKALTYVMNLGRASNNTNMTYQCSEVMSKMQNNFSDFNEGDFQLSTACLLRYAQDIPDLVNVNPLYRLQIVALYDDRDYIASTLLPIFQNK